jgi:DNA-directed RNA polymerase subunit H (RpoH/RPB5)
LDILKRIGYETETYEGFDENEIYTLLETNQLDMILYKNSKDKMSEKVQVKYFINTSKINCDQHFLPKINENFEIPEDKTQIYLTKKDTLIMIVDTEITDKIQDKLKNIYENFGHFVVIHNIARLQYNILTHVKCPKSFHILSDEEVEEFKKKHYIDNLNKIPEISRFDPYALAICLRPGQICRVRRTSVNSLDYDSWVYCV